MGLAVRRAAAPRHRQRCLLSCCCWTWNSYWFKNNYLTNVWRIHAYICNYKYFTSLFFFIPVFWKTKEWNIISSGQYNPMHEIHIRIKINKPSCNIWIKLEHLLQHLNWCCKIYWNYTTIKSETQSTRNNMY